VPDCEQLEKLQSGNVLLLLLLLHLNHSTILISLGLTFQLPLMKTVELTQIIIVVQPFGAFSTILKILAKYIVLTKCCIA
jgi:hypothetical protein